MKKELKKQIKQDEFVSGLGQAAAWVQGHAQELKLGLVTLVVVGLAAYGIGYFQTQRREGADKAFAAALDAFHATVLAEQAPGAPPPAGPSFPTAQEKFRKAAAAFDEVAQRYGSLPTGVRAKYYAALSRVELGEFPEAERALGEIAARRGTDDLEPVLARVALADLHRRSGQIEKAIEELRQMGGDAALAFPRDDLQMRLARALEEARKASEAAAEYRQLVERFPTSAHAAEARRRAEFLLGPKG